MKRKLKRELTAQIPDYLLRYHRSHPKMLLMMVPQFPQN